MYVFGGCYLNTNCYNDLYSYNVLNNSWSLVNFTRHNAVLPKGREGHTATLAGHFVYIIGGIDQQGTLLSDVWRLDLKMVGIGSHQMVFEEIKTQGVTLPGLANHGAQIDMEGRILVFGGTLGSSNENNKLYMFDVLAKRWSLPIVGVNVGSNFPEGRQGFVTAFYSQQFWIYGGINSQGYTNDIYALDSRTLRWSQATLNMNMNPPRKDMAFARVGKDVYLCGGCNYNNQKCYPECYTLNLPALTLAKINLVNVDLFSATEGATMAVRGGTLIYYGGCDRMTSCSNEMLLFSSGTPCPSNCNNHGSCQATTIGACLCDESWWWGNTCMYPTICRNDCSNYHGVCSSMDVCGCFPGYIGEYCQNLVNCPGNCTDTVNGVCLDNGSCKCNQYFKGQACQTDIRIHKETNKNVTPQQKQDQTPQPMSVEKNPNVQTEVLSSQLEDKDKRLNQGQSTGPVKVTSAPPPKNKPADYGFVVHRITGSFSTPTSASSGQVEISQSCPQNCSGHGLCKSNKCYCEPGYTSTICNMSLKNNLTSGTLVKNLLVYFGGVFLFGFIMGSFGVRYFIQKSMKSEYYRKSELNEEAAAQS